MTKMTNKDLAALKAAMLSAKEQLISDINAIDFSISGVTPISDSPNIFTVKLSTIANNNHILSPEYYNVNAQKRRILAIIDNKNTDIFRVIDRLKDVVANKRFGDNTPIHPEVIVALNKYLNTLDS